jgi:hypothetical protein
MLEITEDIPFLWRLSADHDEGFSMVSMVIPFNSGDASHEHTIHTDVISFYGEDESMPEEEVLEWNEDDISLFLKLLSARDPLKASGTTQTFRVDLSDPETIEIVNIVAAAGFGSALVIDDLLISDPGDAGASANVEPEVGARITLHTVDGYKRAVVVGSEEQEIICVLLDSIRLNQLSNEIDIHAHDLIVVKGHQLLPARYSSQQPAAGDILH